MTKIGNIDYLMKKISGDFFDDFYSFYDKGQNEYDYVINLDKVTNWLEIRKENFKRLLEYNFEEDEKNRNC